MFMRQFGWIHSFVSLFAITCFPELDSLDFQKQESTASLEAIGPELLFQRMRLHSVQTEINVIGGYVQKTSTNASDAKMAGDLESVRSAMEKAKQVRVSNDQKNKVKTNLEALDLRMEADFASLKKQMLQKQNATTVAVRYFQEKDKYRIEQFDLNNDESLERLALDLESGKTKFLPTFTRTWNGKEYAELFLDNRSADSLKETQEMNGTYAAFGFNNKAANVLRFTKFSRDSADDPLIFLKLTKDGKVLNVDVIKAANGDDAYILRSGNPASLALYMEVVVLPRMGYCVESSLLKIGGVILSRETYGGFVETSAGFWLPKSISREQYRLDEKQVPVLVSKEELVAFEVPKTNVELTNSVFELSKSDEFKSKPLSDHLLPKRELSTGATIPNKSPGWRPLIIGLNVFLFIACVSIYVYRSRKAR